MSSGLGGSVIWEICWSRSDPALWTKDHVQHWIRWSINQFRLEQVYANQWLWIDGRSLCQITHQQFTEMVPCDPNDLFWTHLELLRKCKFVGKGPHLFPKRSFFRFL